LNDLDAFELHTVHNWITASEEERGAIVRGNQERVRKGVAHWNEWISGLSRWVCDNKAAVCIYFNDSEWVGNTNFKGFQFDQGVSFCRARFVADEAGRGNVDFSGSTFDGQYLSFTNATFFGDVSFESATLSNCLTNFVGAVFHGGAIFNYSEFNRPLSFRSATFKGNEALFEEVNLEGVFVNFDGAEFSGSVTRFRGLSFQGVSFSHAIFSGNVVLKDVRFHGSCDLQNADFRKVLSFIDCTFEQVPDFNFVTFKQPPHLATMLIPWLPKGPNGVPNTEAYRKLKQMAKDVGDYEHELSYFAHELHSKLTLESTSNAHKLGIVMYRVLSCFGQSLVRPLAWALIIFGVTAVIQWAALVERPSLSDIKENWQLECKLEKDGVDPLTAIARERLNAALIILPADRMEQVRISRCLYGDEGYKPFWLSVMNDLHSLLSAACLFLFGLGVRNRFKMK